MTEVTGCPTYRTGIFKISASTKFNITASARVKRSAVALLCFTCVSFICAFFDFRWLIVGLITILSLWPLFAMYLFYTQLLTPDIQQSISPKFIYYFPGIELLEICLNLTTDNGYITCTAHHISIRDIDSPIYRRKHIIIPTREGYNLIIPRSIISPDFEKSLNADIHTKA